MDIDVAERIHFHGIFLRMIEIRHEVKLIPEDGIMKARRTIAVDLGVFRLREFRISQLKIPTIWFPQIKLFIVCSPARSNLFTGEVYVFTS